MTIILPLKGREGFTRRWLLHHARTGLRWKVLIGDGNPESRVEEILSTGIASELDIDYRRFDDRDFRCFYRKLQSLAHVVTTPYVMLFDNDDFLLPHGIESAVGELARLPEYSACGGAVLGVNRFVARRPRLARDVRGDWSDLRVLYPPVALEQESADDRVLALVENYTPVWYCVHRIDVLRECLDAVVKLSMNDPLVMELFHGLHLAARGKVRQDHHFATYLRQTDSSMVNASLGDIFSRAFQGTLVEDTRALCSHFGELAASFESWLGQSQRDRLETAVIARERRNATADRGARGPKLLATQARAWRFALRLRIPVVHRIFQSRELRLVLAQVSGGDKSGCNSASRARLCAEIRSALDTLSTFESGSKPE